MQQNLSLIKEGWAKRYINKNIRVVKVNDEIIQSGVHPDNVRKWNVLQNL
jgi:hypothetical protein